MTSSVALAHHGWGSYDAAKPFTIRGQVETLRWQNPHVHVDVKHQGATWEAVLAPPFRMEGGAAVTVPQWGEGVGKDPRGWGHEHIGSAVPRSSPTAKRRNSTKLQVAQHDSSLKRSNWRACHDPASASGRRVPRPDTLVQTGQITSQKPLADGAGHTFLNAAMVCPS